jgi:hypothetical protein
VHLLCRLTPVRPSDELELNLTRRGTSRGCTCYQCFRETIIRGGGAGGSDLVIEAVSIEFVPVSAEEVNKPSVPTTGQLLKPRK